MFSQLVAAFLEEMIKCFISRKAFIASLIYHHQSQLHIFWKTSISASAQLHPPRITDIINIIIYIYIIVNIINIIFIIIMIIMITIYTVPHVMIIIIAKCAVLVRGAPDWKVLSQLLDLPTLPWDTVLFHMTRSRESSRYVQTSKKVVSLSQLH